MTAHQRASLGVLLVAMLDLASLASNRPQPPTFVRAPSVLSTQDAIWVELQIEPHPDIRSVLLELWQAEPADDQDPPMSYQLGPLVRGSVEPVDAHNRDQRIFAFHWESEPEGIYALIGRVGATRGLTYSSPLHLLEVR